MTALGLPFVVPPTAIAPISQAKSTLISSSLQTVRAHGLAEAYFAHLEPGMEAEIRALVAGMWVPVHIAFAHYRSVDMLVPEPSRQIEFGREVADRVHRTVLATFARLATGAGVTPWTGLLRVRELWTRLFVGGGVAMHQTGPKDARIEVVGSPLFDLRYVRSAFEGLVCAGCELFARKAFFHEPIVQPKGRLVFTVSWA